MGSLWAAAFFRAQQPALAGVPMRCSVEICLTTAISKDYSSVLALPLSHTLHFFFFPLAWVPAGLFLLYFLTPLFWLPLHSRFYPFLIILSQKFQKRHWRAQLCPVVGPYWDYLKVPLSLFDMGTATGVISQKPHLQYPEFFCSSIGKIF